MMIAIFFWWIGLSIVVAVAANTRGRSPIAWFIYAIIFSPLLSGLLLLALPNFSNSFAAGRMYLEGGRRGRANGDRGVDDARVVLVRVGNSIQLANRCESGDAVARWGNCSDCFVVRSLDCSCPARGVKRRSWFFASRSTCSGASRQRDRPSITPIVCCSSGCLAACQIKFWGPVAANPSPARANPGRTTPPIHPSVSLRQGQR